VRVKRLFLSSFGSVKLTSRPTAFNANLPAPHRMLAAGLALKGLFFTVNYLEHWRK